MTNNPLENWQSAAKDLTILSKRLTLPIEGRRLHPSVLNGEPKVSSDDCMRLAILFDLYGSARRLTRSHVENPRVQITIPEKARQWVNKFVLPDRQLQKVKGRIQTYEVSATLDQYMLGRLLLRRSLFYPDLATYLIRRAVILVGSHEELSLACSIPDDSLPYGSLSLLP